MDEDVEQMSGEQLVAVFLQACIAYRIRELAEQEQRKKILDVDFTPRHSTMFWRTKRL